MERLLSVRAQDVWFRFGDRYALAGADLEATSGQPVLLVGPNGGGKTTLLRILAGLLVPAQGKVSWQSIQAPGGAEPVPLEESIVARRRLFLPASPSLYPDLSATENLTLMARLWGLERPESVAKEALERLGLDPTDRRPVSRLSRGQRRRADLARIVALPADILLLDEPESGLDPQGRAFLIHLLGTFQGLCIVATHDEHLTQLPKARIYRVVAGHTEPLESPPGVAT